MADNNLKVYEVQRPDGSVATFKYTAEHAEAMGLSDANVVSGQQVETRQAPSETKSDQPETKARAARNKSAG